MKKLNIILNICAVLLFVAAQSATAQLRTSSAALAKDPTAQAPAATVAPVTTTTVGHYGYTSSQSYSPTVGRQNTSAPVFSPVGKKANPVGRISTTSSARFSTQQTGSIALGSGSGIRNGAADDEFIPEGDGGKNPYAGGVTPAPVGNGLLALLVLLLAYASFLLIRSKVRKD